VSFDSLLVQTGRLEEVVPVTLRTTSGEVIETWQPVGEFRCLRRNAKEPADLAPGIDSAVTDVIYARPFVTDGRTLRVVLEGITYRIVSARNPGQRQHHLELLCRREATA